MGYVQAQRGPEKSHRNPHTPIWHQAYRPLVSRLKGTHKKERKKGRGAITAVENQPVKPMATSENTPMNRWQMNWSSLAPNLAVAPGETVKLQTVCNEVSTMPAEWKWTWELHWFIGKIKSCFVCSKWWPKIHTRCLCTFLSSQLNWQLLKDTKEISFPLTEGPLRC